MLKNLILQDRLMINQKQNIQVSSSLVTYQHSFF